MYPLARRSISSCCLILKTYNLVADTAPASTSAASNYKSIGILRIEIAAVGGITEGELGGAQFRSHICRFLVILLIRVVVEGLNKGRGQHEDRIVSEQLRTQSKLSKLSFMTEEGPSVLLDSKT